ncbi:MAG TPA: chemotaxis protein CheW [Clostridia bacterium]|nr:chemotaxis protein CheW [Clostridia bacterium]
MERILTFYLEGELFGIDVGLVKEINRKIKYTQVPGAPGHIVGLYNMRGQVVTIFDIACILHNRESHIPQGPTCIILKNDNSGSEHLGFIVDRPGDVLDVRDEWRQPLPENVEHEYGQYIKEIVRLEDELAAVIDIDRMFGK